MMPLAPARLSMTIGWRSESVSLCESARARMSEGPAGGHGTMRRTGLVGYSWACAPPSVHDRAMMHVQIVRGRVFTRSPEMFGAPRRILLRLHAGFFHDIRPFL